MIKVFGEEKTASVESLPNESLLELLRRCGFGIQAPCGGAGICGKCSVEAVLKTTGARETLLACETPAATVTEVYLPENGEAAVLLESPELLAIGALGAEALPAGAIRAIETLGTLGIAVDLGTTTLALTLWDLDAGIPLATAGTLNPQSPWGGDVISRITACTQGNLDLLHHSVLEAIGNLQRQVCASQGISPEAITSLVLAGNTVMESIAANLDPSPIGVAPFVPPSLFGYDINLKNPDIAGYFMPCISGYVGGDIVAGALACDLDLTAKNIVLMDLGTNGEILVSKAGKLFACSTACGPVFEGAGIACGMMASAGAITAIATENGNLVFETIDNQPPKGLCGTGFLSVVAWLLREGFIDETGLLEATGANRGPLADHWGEIDGFQAFFLTDEIFVTQKDIRALQLAKGAIAAGLQTLLETCGLDGRSLDRVLIAGGLGAALNPADAITLGLLPAALEGKISVAGNASLAGASLVLRDPALKSRTQAIAESTTYLELSSDLRFNALFLDAMNFEA